MSRPLQNEGIPPEYPPIGDKEFGKLPDEFNRQATSDAKKPEDSRKKLTAKKVLLYLVSTGLIALGTMFPVMRAVSPEPMPSPSPELFVDAPVATPAPSLAPTVSPSPASTVAPYPARTSGIIEITVHFDRIHPDFDWQAPDWDMLLWTLPTQSFDEADFETFPLPDPPVVEEYEWLGYIVQSTESYDPALITVSIGKTLTREQIAIVPVDADGVRRVHVHALWRFLGTSQMLLLLDDGETTVSYAFNSPIDSEGLCYLAAYPAPERTNSIFLGWFDADGRRVEALPYYAFFAPAGDGSDPWDRDWQQPTPVTLTARWAP